MRAGADAKACAVARVNDLVARRDFLAKLRDRAHTIIPSMVISFRRGSRIRHDKPLWLRRHVNDPV